MRRRIHYRRLRADRSLVRVGRHQCIASAQLTEFTYCSLILTGYVLTAASCVWDVNSNEAVEPSNITLWVGGETIPVAFFNISDCE